MGQRRKRASYVSVLKPFATSVALSYIAILITFSSERPEFAWCLQNTPEWEKSLAFSFDHQVEGVDILAHIKARCNKLHGTTGGAREAFFGAIFGSHENKGAFFCLWRYDPSTLVMSLSEPEVSTDLDARNVESSTFFPACRNIGLALCRIALHNDILIRPPRISAHVTSLGKTAAVNDDNIAPLGATKS
ncbi:hypothetical protein DL93DRAFT_451706 [Clavulina sp. PMI_390]|nr:hypothetical protein DL93DRAFT_451706 [Clavulina sp. PMI_390]